jgi:hypothetical protein
VDATQGELQRARDQLGVARKQKARPARQREHPLSHRHAREHAIDQVGRCALHPSRRAGRTNSTAFTGERDEQLVAASTTLHADEAVGENAAAQVPLELGHDEAGQPAPVLLELRQEGLQMLPHRLVQERLLRLAAPITRNFSGGLAWLSSLRCGLRKCLGLVHGAGDISRSGPIGRLLGRGSLLVSRG